MYRNTPLAYRLITDTQQPQPWRTDSLGRFAAVERSVAAAMRVALPMRVCGVDVRDVAWCGVFVEICSTS